MVSTHVLLPDFLVCGFISARIYFIFPGSHFPPLRLDVRPARIIFYFHRQRKDRVLTAEKLLPQVVNSDERFQVKVMPVIAMPQGGPRGQSWSQSAWMKMFGRPVVRCCCRCGFGTLVCETLRLEHTPSAAIMTCSRVKRLDLFGYATLSIKYYPPHLLLARNLSTRHIVQRTRPNLNISLSLTPVCSFFSQSKFVRPARVPSS